TNPYDVPLADHEYDGIQELDNPAPFWWQLFFYLSIAFAFGYYIYYAIGTGASSDFRLNEELTEIHKLQAKHALLAPSEGEFEKLAANPAVVSTGKQVFQAQCASCHAADGGGLIGPNLTDRYWIHGKGGYPDLFKVISAGVLDKGMPAWGGILKHDDLLGAVVYVKTLAGTHPSVAKAPQGSEVKD
ncbi:nitrogen fixation protein FixP, partial [bacterium]|nr:nitrogen fixation protein FixP [bacterium]